MVLALGCSTRAKPTKSPLDVARAQRAAKVRRLERSNRRQAKELRELRGLLALARAESADLRRSKATPPRTTVRISHRASEHHGSSHDGSKHADPDYDESSEWSSDEHDEQPGQSSGPRPVLRLYGSSADRILTAPSPSVPAGLPPSSVPPLVLPSRPSSVPDTLPTAGGPMPNAGVPTAVRSMTPTSAFARGSTAVVAEYRRALSFVRAREFRRALPAMRQFAQAHPTHAYADNALYWQGELLYLGRRYAKSIEALSQIVERYPRGNKVAAALLKMGMCHLRLGDRASAAKYFHRVRAQFPTSPEARLAPREDA